MFTSLALICFVVGVDVAGYGLTALAFGVAALNASTGLCLGCKAYPLFRRTPRPKVRYTAAHTVKKCTPQNRKN